MQFTKRFSAVMGTIALVLGLSLVTITHSQEGTTKSTDAPKTDSAKTEAPKAEPKKRAEPKGRLPAYYGEVVDKEQREKIYAVQAKYLSEIKKLQDQLENAIEQRDQEVEAVLTSEQKEKVAKLVAEAKAKREAAKKKPEKSDKPETPAATSATKTPTTESK